MENLARSFPVEIEGLVGGYYLVFVCGAIPDCLADVIEPPVVLLFIGQSRMFKGGVVDNWVLGIKAG